MEARIVWTAVQCTFKRDRVHVLNSNSPREFCETKPTVSDAAASEERFLKELLYWILLGSFK